MDDGGGEDSSSVRDTVHSAETVEDVIAQFSIIVADPGNAIDSVEKTALMACVDGPSVRVTGCWRAHCWFPCMHCTAMMVSEGLADTTLPWAPVMGRVVWAALKAERRVVSARVVAVKARREKSFILFGIGMKDRGYRRMDRWIERGVEIWRYIDS